MAVMLDMGTLRTTRPLRERIKFAEVYTTRTDRKQKREKYAMGDTVTRDGEDFVPDGFYFYVMEDLKKLKPPIVRETMILSVKTKMSVPSFLPNVRGSYIVLSHREEYRYNKDELPEIVRKLKVV